MDLFSDLPELPPATLQPVSKDADLEPPSKRPRIAGTGGGATVRNVVSAAAFGDKGKRKIMEDVHLIVDDLHAHAKKVVVPLITDSEADRNVLTPDLAQRVDSTNLQGLARKAAVHFARLLVQSRKFSDPTYQGLRLPRVEVYAVFDGHGGRRAAEYCRQWFPLYIYFELLHLALETPEPVETGALHCLQYSHLALERAFTEACHKLDAAFLEEAEVEKWADGCTVVACVVIEGEMHCVSVGDSKGIMPAFREGTTHLTTLHVISGKEHKPTAKAEAHRVARIPGAFIAEGRVNGVLGVTRSIGDAALKKTKGIIPTPSVAHYPLALSPFILLACDGLWDVFPKQSAVEFVYKRLRGGEETGSIVTQLVREAVNVRNSKDNVTALLVRLLPTSSPPPDAPS